MVHQNFVAPKCFFPISSCTFKMLLLRFRRQNFTEQNSTTTMLLFLWTAINDNFTDRKGIKQRYVKPYHLICELLMLRSCLFESLCHPLECHNDLYYSFSWIDNSSFLETFWFDHQRWCWLRNRFCLVEQL